MPGIQPKKTLQGRTRVLRQAQDEENREGHPPNDAKNKDLILRACEPFVGLGRWICESVFGMGMRKDM
jgi:hypothetical protein